MTNVRVLPPLALAQARVANGLAGLEEWERLAVLRRAVVHEMLGRPETLEARAPGMLERHLPSQAARDFYRTYRIGRTGMRMDERQAMVLATTATSDVGADETRAPQFKKIEEELANSQSIFPWTQGVTNFGDMREDITRVSRALVRTGTPPDAAVKLAGDDVRKQYTNVNGYMVRTGDRAIEMFGAHLSSAGLQPKPFRADRVLHARKS